MSTWNLGINDVTEQEQAMKDKLSSKDGHIAALQTQLMKQSQELREIQDTYNENLRKLADETNRALQLEADLNARSESLRNEKIASQNTSLALDAARETVKQKELDARDLQANLESLSHLSDRHKSQADKLAQEKATLEARVRELQATYNQTSTPLTTPGHRRTATHSRSRSSSPSRANFLALEQELVQVRSSLAQKEADILLANEKAARAQDELIRAGNEKVALERRMTRQLAETQASLEEKEEELRDLQGMLGDESRERELEQRIEEDEAKMSAMEMSHRAEEAMWRKRVKELEDELQQQHRHLTGAEVRQDTLTNEKEKALHERDNLRAKLSSLEEILRLDRAQTQERDGDESTTALPPNEDTLDVGDETATTVQRLLTAIDRLRAERNDLQTRVDFLQSESKFEIDALNAKLVAVSEASSVAAVDEQSAKTIEQLKIEIDALAAQLTEVAASEQAVVLMKERENRSLNLAATASAIVIQYLHSQEETLEQRIFESCYSRNQVERQLLGAQQNLDELEDKLKGLEVKLDVTVLCLEATTSQRDDVISQLEDKDAELEQAAVAIKAAEESQDYFKQQLDIVESERSSLALQLANLQNDLSGVRNNLKAAESRYSDLQFHQLDAMSKTEATRMLQNELTEERSRVGRRDDHIAMLQHDIQRLETNLRLQEERLGEMTMELEVMSAAKDAMVDDCAEVREERDRAQARLDMLETEMETRLEDGDRAVEALVEVVMTTVGNAKDSVRIQTENARLAKEALAKFELEHKKSLRSVEEKVVGLSASEDVEEPVRQSTVALAVSQVGLAKALAHIQEIMEEKEILQREIRSQRDDLDQQSAQSEALQKQHEVLQHQAAATTLDFANRTAELEHQIQGLQDTISETKSTHRAAVEELLRSKEHLTTALEQAQRSLADNDSNHDFARIREQHAVELSEVHARLSESLGALEELRSSQKATKEDLEKSLADALNAKRLLEKQLAENSESLRRSALQQQATEERRDEIAREVLRLQKDLDTALTQKQAMEAARDQSQASLECVSEQLETFQVQQEGHLAEVTEQHLGVQRQLEGKLAELHVKLDDQCQELDKIVQERDRLIRRLEEEVCSRATEKASHEKELTLLDQQWKDAQSASAHLLQEMQVIQNQLNKSVQEIEDLHEEKSSLQQEITILEAEIQRSISLGRFLESQVKESEAKFSSFTEEVKQLQADLARSEKATKAAEVNLSLQGAQHKREMSDLNRQLAALRSQPDLQKALSELEERNNEMEELLRNKCTEIEENDDRALEMLKENKKLTTKVESLTRKVQNLQTKLAAAKASMPTPSNPSPPNQASSSTAPAPSAPSSAIKNSTSRPRSTTLISNPSMSAIPPVPPLPAYIPSVPAYVPSPATRTPLQRAVSGPSSLPRPKTPERRAAQPPPVFKARTPERRTVSSPEASSSSTTIGKKRRAPDDFEASETLPPQGFTVDSLPSRESGDDTNITPRVRRVLSGFQSGFTPVRNQTRPMTSIPSPKRLMMGTMARSSPVIADVTNSPRGQSAKGKRSWLGKIRGASSQAMSRPMDSRPRFEPETS